jgi:TonB-dependent SusC/RagA subfamily outer membrane receptor
MRRSPIPIVLAAALAAAGCRMERLVHPTVAPASEGSRVDLGPGGDVLYVLDGRVLARGDSTGVPPAVRNLDPGSIRSVEVLKGATAKRAYGAAGASGVVVITTNRGA